MTHTEGTSSMAKDPVCGMDVDPKTSKLTAEHAGKTSYFCGPGCRKAFQDDPAHFLDPDYKAHM